MLRYTWVRNIDWNDVIKKEARGINDADLEVQESQEEYVIVEKE